MTVKSLTSTPFQPALTLGILLFMFVGMGPVIAALLTSRRQAVGLTLMAWVKAEMVMRSRAS
jgi:hypothetical protein